MIKISNLKLKDYEINMEILNNQKVGFFSKDPSLINTLLLQIAGIIKTNKNITYYDKDVYDNYTYFKNRIYLDCNKRYFQTIKADDIVNGIRLKYHKNIDLDKLKIHFNKLRVRGECEINRGYIISKCGSNLINLSVLLSSNDDLIINSPTINITRENDINYFKNELRNYKHTLILGLDSIKKISGVCDKIYLITDQNTIEEITENDIFYVIPSNEMITPLLNLDNYYIARLSKEDMKLCDKYKIKYKKISTLDIESFMVKNDV